MSMVLSFDQLESVAPTQQEKDTARESSRKLARLLKGVALDASAGSLHAESLTFEIRLENEHEIVSMPASVLSLVNHILTQVAQGNMVTAVPQQCEMTTRQAANFLNVSRPYLVALLEKGEMKYHKVGTHRRIFFGDVAAYKAKLQAKSEDALAELIAEGQKLNMGY